MAVLRGGRFTGGDFKPRTEEIAAAGVEAASSAGQAPTTQQTIAPSGQGRLPSEKAGTIPITQQQAQPTTQRAAPKSGAGSRLMDIADRLVSQQGSTTTPGLPSQQASAPVVDEAGLPVVSSLAERTAFQTTSGRRGKLSPTAEEVWGVDVPVAGSVIGQSAALETEAERRQRYEDEQKRQLRPGAEQLGAAIAGLGVDAQASFDSNAVEMSIQMQNLAANDATVRDSMIEAGILDSQTGIIPEPASRTMLFVMSSMANKAQAASERRVQDAISANERGEMSDADLDKTLYDANAETFVSEAELQSGVADQFAQLMGIEQAQDAQGRIAEPEFLKSTLSTQQKTALGFATPQALVKMKFLEPKEKLNETTGEMESGYVISGSFIESMQDMKGVLDDFSPDFARDVTFTPNRGGVPSGMAGLVHRDITKSPTKESKIEKGSDVWKALDAMGTTANGVNRQQLGTTLGFLQSVVSHRQQTIQNKPHMQHFSFSDHPMAEMFLLGEASWFRAMKVAKGKFKQEFGRTFPKEISGVKDMAGLTKVMQMVATNIQNGVNVDHMNRLKQDIMDLRQATNRQHSLYASSFLKAVLDGARLDGKSFYHTYTPHAATSRPMVGSTSFNYQANKMARGLHANPRPVAVIVGRSQDTKETKAWKAIVARNLHDKGEHAINANHLVEMFKEIESDPEMRQIALALYAGTQAHTAQVVKDTAAGLTQTWQQAKEANYGSTDAQMLSLQSPQFPNIGLNVDMTPEMMTRLAVVAGLLDSKGRPQKSDEVHFKLMALRDLGEYLAKTRDGKSGVIQTQITAEADGISNGVIIQGYQFGDVDVLMKGGVLYAYNKELDEFHPVEDILEDGDLRQAMHSFIVDGEVNEQLAMNPAEAKRIQLAYQKAFLNENSEVDGGKVKDLHKLPLMTTVYGMDADFHGENIGKFLGNNPDIEKSLMGDLDINDRADLVKEMQRIEGIILRGLLTGVLEHQVVIKNASNAAIAAGKLLKVKGPNGWTVVSGGRETREVDRLELNVDGETRSVPVVQSFGTAYESKIYEDKDDGTTESADFGDLGSFDKQKTQRVKVGTKLRNQAAVTGTQNIDATVVQRGFTKAKQLVGDNFWGAQVFDAVIGDVSSFATMVDTMNAEFDRVNREYNMIEAEIEAVQQVRKEIRQDVALAKKSGLKFDVTPDGAYRGLYDILENLTSEKRGAHRKGLITTAPSRSDRQLTIKRLTSKDIGWRPGGTQMTPDQFLAAWEYAIKQLEIEPSMRRLRDKAKKNRDKVQQLLQKQREEFGYKTRQYS